MIGPGEDSSNRGAKESPSPFAYVPYGDYVQVAPNAAGTQGGIIIPSNARMGFVVVEVLAAGAGCKLVKAGDRVLIHPDGMVKAKHDGCEVAFTKEDKILAVVKTADPSPPEYPVPVQVGLPAVLGLKASPEAVEAAEQGEDFPIKAASGEAATD